MPATVSADKIHRALLKFVTDGSFPESEDITQAEYPITALPAGLQQISEARQQVEREISALSQDKASDVDEWILQAKQLHEDIEKSKSAAREIVKNHEKVQTLRNQVHDTAAKVKLLQRETTFTQSLRDVLGKARAIDRDIIEIQGTSSDGDLEAAIQKLEKVGRELEQLPLPQGSHILTILTDKASQVRATLCGLLQKTWHKLVHADESAGSFSFGSDDPSVLDRHVLWLSDLGILESTIVSSGDKLLKYILQPVLSPSKNAEYRLLVLEGKDHIKMCSQSSKPAVSDILSSILTLFTFIKNRLPVEALQLLSPILSVAVAQLLISEWLSPAIPMSLQDTSSLEDVLDETLRFSKELAELGWNEPAELGSWTTQIPRLWLSRRRAHALDQVRLSIYHDSGKLKKAERVEKQRISRSESVLPEGHAEKDVEDDWNTNWDNDNDEEATGGHGSDNDEEDVSAWGLDDEPDKEEPNEVEGDKGGDDVDDAWGWGEDDTNDTSHDKPAPKALKTSGKQADVVPPEELTLKEFYTVTNVPDAISEVIREQIVDSRHLKQSESSSSLLAPSGAALLGIPTLAVAMFKATAPVFYSQTSASSCMFLYNDSIFLAEKLRILSEEHDFSRLSSDIESIEKFGRLSYGKEMHSQRTILADLLDGCQGFSSCNTQPYLGECERAIKATVDRARSVHAEWRSILSPSVLLQSIGSLISTGINKIILDIEDLGDISDPESQRLAGFCNVISKLEDLFLPDASESSTEPGTEPIAMTAIYVPNWLKFQYLINILESSLADIKYLWTEGELKLEFSPEELIDLIKALFADSEHRRKAISDIRASA